MEVFQFTSLYAYESIEYRVTYVLLCVEQTHYVRMFDTTHVFPHSYRNQHNRYIEGRHSNKLSVHIKLHMYICTWIIMQCHTYVCSHSTYIYVIPYIENSELTFCKINTYVCAYLCICVEVGIVCTHVHTFALNPSSLVHLP